MRQLLRTQAERKTRFLELCDACQPPKIIADELHISREAVHQRLKRYKLRLVHTIHYEREDA